MLVIFSMYLIGHQHLKLVTDMFGLSSIKPNITCDTFSGFYRQNRGKFFDQEKEMFHMIPNKLGLTTRQSIQCHNSLFCKISAFGHTHLDHRMRHFGYDNHRKCKILHSTSLGKWNPTKHWSKWSGKNLSWLKN